MRFAAALLALTLGCSTSGATDATSTTDAARTDAPDASDGSAGDDSTPDGAASAPKCPTPIAGSEPFGVVLGAEDLDLQPASSTHSPKKGSVFVDVFFPQGRTPGAPVVLAQPDGCTYRRLRAATASVGDDGRIDVKMPNGYGADLLDGALLPPTDGFFGDVHVSGFDWLPGDDVVVTRVAKGATLCAVREAPPSALGVLATGAPNAPIHLLASAPLDPAVLDVGVKTGDGASIPTTTSHDRGLLTVRATSAFPPGKPLVLDTSKLRDVLGRALVAPSGPLPVLTTTSIVVDGTFDTEPPDGATIGGSTSGGRFRASVTTTPHSPKPLGAALSLGAPGPGQKLRLRIGAFGCAVETRVSLVAADGQATKIAVPCGIGTLADGGAVPVEVSDVVVTPPAPGPLWLSISGGASTCVEGLGAGAMLPYGVEIDELAFE